MRFQQQGILFTAKEIPLPFFHYKATMVLLGFINIIIDKVYYQSRCIIICKTTKNNVNLKQPLTTPEVEATEDATI